MAFAGRFDDWWDSYKVVPLAAEVTIWNHQVGYAGTLDLVAEISKPPDRGRLREVFRTSGKVFIYSNNGDAMARARAEIDGLCGGGTGGGVRPR